MAGTAAVAILVAAALVAMLVVAAKPEVEARVRRWRRGGDLSEALARRVRDAA